MQTEELNKIGFSKPRQQPNVYSQGPPMKAYYPRLTPQDILNEEIFFNDQVSYDASSIYDWNIDGMSEYLIHNILHRMLMYASICRANNRNSDHTVAKFITAGFTGQLKGWWDNYLSPIQRNEILNSIKITTAEDGSINTQEDAVYTLIQTILKHFVGTSLQSTDKSKELLMNLRCPTLTHFRWYKDVFLAKVLLRSDANNEFWKEKFISGLPSLFAEKIRIRLKQRHGGFKIPYENYTYGELISECISEGLALCNDLNLKAQLKRQRLTGRKELGEFCNQFAYNLDIPKDKISRKTYSKPYKKGRKLYKKSYAKEKEKVDKPPKKI